MEKFKGLYRIESARIQGWNYGWAGLYFITICTKDRVCWFGKMVNHKISLSDIGTIVEMEWRNTFEMRPDMNLYMGEFVIMPNHFHAIIGIGTNRYNIQYDDHRRDAMHCVSNTPPKTTISSQSNNLASIVRGFKASVTKQARMLHVDFAWQSRYYDHIIRDEKSFHAISTYIINNPAQWAKDELYL
jgi:REP element-mobilizing transposase RayT